MKYSNFSSVFDFVEDAYFQEWVRRPSEEMDFFWKSYMANHPDKITMVAQAKEILLSINFKQHDLGQAEMDTVMESILKEKYSGAHQAKDNQPLIQPYDGQKLARKAWWTGLTKIAAVILLALTALAFLWQSAQVKPVNMENETMALIEKTIPKGQKSTFKLSDGSVVKVNAGSTIRFPKSFSQAGERVVFLEGEAYFQVAKNENKPFIVKTGDISTKVLGTKFNVRFYPGNNSVQVAVESGSVAVKSEVSPGQGPVVLAPNEMALASNSSPGLSKQGFDFEETFGWKDEVLLFNDAGLSEIIPELERWFDIKITVSGERKDKIKFTGRFKNANLEEILNGISFSSKITYEVKGKDVQLIINDGLQ